MRTNKVLKFGKEVGFTQTFVKISSIHPNPFRQLDRYPLNENKIAKLVSSIKRNQFWENVMARKSPNGFQLAYGHHRVEAARRIYGDEAEIKILVGDLSDAQMLQFMAADNDEVFNLDARFVLEVVEAATGFLGKDLSHSPVKAMRGNVPVMVRGEGELARKIAKFLNWPWHRVATAIAALRSIQAGRLSAEAATIMPSQKSLDNFRHGLDQAAQFGTPIAHSVQVEIAKQVAKHANPSLAARVLISEHTHPIQIENQVKPLQKDIDEACRHGAAFDLALSKLVRQKQALDSCRGIEKIRLAVICADVSKSIALLNE